MKTPKILLSLSLLALAGSAYADMTTTTVIEGTENKAQVTKLVFDNDNVSIFFADGSRSTAQMDLVSITIDYADNSAISDVIADPKAKKGIYNIQGQYLGESPENLQPGFYIIDGQKIYIK